jgi:hypothetical protein
MIARFYHGGVFGQRHFFALRVLWGIGATSSPCFATVLREGVLGFRVVGFLAGEFVMLRE